jgi:hypothetical protein
MAADTRQATTRNKNPDEMFVDALRELIVRHFAWSKPPSRVVVAKALQVEANKILGLPAQKP